MKGQDISDVREDFRRELLYFGHHPGVKAVLTPEENLHWYAAMHPSIKGNQISEL